LSVAVLLFAVMLGTPRVHAQTEGGASLFLDPATAIIPIGEEFDVRVRIDTANTAVGTADALIAYEPQDLEFVSFSSEDSIFGSIIVPDEDTPGRVKVQGVVSQNRGVYTGTDGLFVTLTFRPLRNTATEVRFMQGAATPLLAAAGGSVSNVLSGLGAATYTLIPREVVPVAAVAYASEEAQFEITPIPVPDDEWFATTSVTLSWTLPDSVTEMRTHTSDNPNDVPTKEYAIPVTQVTIPDLTEGTNYFHLQFKFSDEWGPVIHYPIKVDITEPDYVVITEAERSDASDPRAAFAIEAADIPSGVARYEVIVDNEEPVVWNREDRVYRPEGLEPGEHLLTVFAYDRAGNSTSSDIEFLVRSLNPPTLTESPDHVLTGNPITVRGTTYPDADVTVYISYEEGEATEKVVRSDATGTFVATLTDAAREGKYTVWFSVADDRGAVSPPSIKRSVKATQPFIMLFGGIAVTYLSVIIPLLALLLLLGVTLWLLYTYVRGYRRRVKRETGQAYSVVREEFEQLREDLIRQIGMIEQANQSRELTREELRIWDELHQKLTKIERHIAMEIADIEHVEEPEHYSERHTDPAQPTALARAQAASATPAQHTVTIEKR
jgi:hypothetical protein